jgi:hypothetical protein
MIQPLISISEKRRKQCSRAVRHSI